MELEVEAPPERGNDFGDRLDPDEVKVIGQVVDGMLLKHEAGKYAATGLPTGPHTDGLGISR